MTLANKVQQFSDDADTLNAIVHGPATGDGSTVATNGGARRTLAKIDADLQGQGYVAQVLQGVTDAQTAKTAAEAARDAANTSGRAYTSAQGTAAALADAAVTTGQTFAVVAADLLSYTIYRKDAGPVATLMFSQYTKAYIDASMVANVWPDPFFESVSLRPYNTATVQGFAGTLNAASATSPYNRPYLSYLTGSNAQSIMELSDLPFKVGDTIRVRAHCFFSAGSGQVTVFFRKSDGTVVSSTAKALTSVDTGEQIILVDPLTIPATTGRIEVRVSQGGDGRVYAVAVGNGIGIPAFSQSPNPGSRINRAITQRNLWPDPFFRQLAAGITHHEGWTYGQLAGLATPPVVTTSVNSPFPDQRVLRFPAGTGQLDMNIDAKRLGLRSGDKLTLVLGVFSAQSMNVAFFGRTTAGAAVGSAANTSFTFPGTGASRDLRLTITVDETFAKTVAYLNVRVLNGQVVGATPIEIWGRGIFVNQTDPLLYDDSYADDVREIAMRRALPWNTQTMREMQKRVAELQFGAANTLTLALIGDSFTHLRQRYSGPLAAKLQSDLGYAGHGWIGFGNPDTGTGNINGSVLSDVVVTVSGAVPASAYRTAQGPDICSVTLTDPTSQYRVNGLPAGTTSLKLFGKKAVGVVEYTTDSGATWLQVDLSTGGAFSLNPLTVPATAFNLWLRFVSGTVVLYGIEHRKGTSGVIVHKLGATGSLLQDWAAQVTSAEWQACLAALAPNAVSVMLATNDQTGSRSPALFRADMQTMVASIAAAVPTADILLLAPPENQRANNVAMAAYASVIRAVARENNYAFHDLQQDYGRAAPDYAFGSTRPWMKSDGIHPNEDPAVNGGYPIAARIRKIVLNG